MTGGKGRRWPNLRKKTGRRKRWLENLARNKEMLKALMKKTGGARRAQGRSALAVRAFSGEPAADLRADACGGIEPAVCEPEERRGVASATGGSSAGRAEVGIPAVAVEAGSERDAGEPQAGVSGVPGSGIADPAEKKEALAASGIYEARVDRSKPGVGHGFCA